MAKVKVTKLNTTELKSDISSSLGNVGDKLSNMSVKLRVGARHLRSKSISNKSGKPSKLFEVTAGATVSSTADEAALPSESLPELPNDIDDLPESPPPDTPPPASEEEEDIGFTSD